MKEDREAEQQKIRDQLNRMILTREDLAKSVGINYTNFTQFLKGRKGLDEKNINKCIYFLNRK